MDNEETKMDCSISYGNEFSKKFRMLLYVAIFYTGILSLWGIFSIGGLLSEDILGKGLEQQSINSVIWENMSYLAMMFCFLSLIKLAVTKKPFSDIRVNCLYAIGILLIAGSLLFTGLPLYQPPHFIIGIEGGPYIDGLPCTIGIMFLIFGKIVRYGLVYQKEIDMVI